PEDGFIQSNLGVTYFGLEKYDKAVASFEAAIKLEPKLAEAHTGLGSAYLKQKKFEEARNAFNQAIKLEPNFAVAHMNRALTCLELKDRDCALEDYGSLQRIDPVLAQDLSARLFRNRVVVAPADSKTDRH